MIASLSGRVAIITGAFGRERLGEGAPDRRRRSKASSAASTS